MVRDLRYRLRALFRRREMERELDEELAFHLEKSIEAHVAAGKSRAEAERLARIELGGVEGVKEDCREARGVKVVEDLATDVRYGVRILLRAPAFTLVAVLTLALGIGANSAMFSVVSAVLRHPLPYDAPDQLVRLHGKSPSFERGSISFPNFLDWQANNRSFSAIAVSRSGAFTLTGAGTAERVSADLVSADYFTVLGVRPIVGRALAKGEDLPGGKALVMLGEALWARKFDRAAEIVGRSIILDGNSYQVIGVMPAAPDLRRVSGANAPDLYMPIGQINPRGLQARGAGLGIHGIGRLKPDVSIAQARADLTAVTESLATTYPQTNKSLRATIDPLRDSVIGNVRPYVILLVGAVGLVLLIACVNVANLLLARSTGRSREFGIRLALGAGVGRLVRQLLTESLLLSFAGGALGLVVAWWCLDLLGAVLPRGFPRFTEVGVDGGVLAFTMVLAVVAGVLAGLTPALKATRRDLHDALKEGGRGPSTTRYRTQAVFVVVQMAMALVLLVGASLLVRTLVRLGSETPGYRPDGVITMGVSMSPGLREAEPARIRAELANLERAIANVSGVQALAFAWGATPIEGDDQTTFRRDDLPEPAPGKTPLTQRFIVGPGYLDAMGVRLVRGRFFTTRDDATTPLVTVIDEAFAAQHFPGEDPVGKYIRSGDNDYERPIEIVGVVGHIKQWGLDSDETTAVRAQSYISFAQLPDDAIAETPNGFFALARVRDGTSTDAIRRAVAATSAENVVFRVRTANEIIGGYQATRRFAMYVLTAFAVLALLLSCIGIYGVVSYVVTQRTSEIGIRMALGARPAQIMAMVLRQGAKLAVAGVAIGLCIAAALAPSLGGLIYGVSAIDPVTFVAVPAAVIVIALGAMLLPARRAMRVDPMVALRHE